MTNSAETIMIIGAGIAGIHAAEALRNEEYEGRIVLIDRDTELPYDRPPLSKEFMLGESTETDIALHTQENLEELQIDLKLGVEIVSIDSEKQSAVLSDGETINWDKLLLTTGSSLRRLPIQGLIWKVFTI